MHAVQKLQLHKKIVEKVTNLVATDARFTTRHNLAKCVGISVGAAHTILRRDLFKNEKDKCQMDTPSRYKRIKSCSGKNGKTIVETVPQIQQSIFSKYHHWG